MPHVIVKMWPGRDEEFKTDMARKVAKTVSDELGCDIGRVSVTYEIVDKDKWGETIYKDEIKDNPNLYHKQDYEYIDGKMCVDGMPVE
ncbi:MAG: tautomerase family protein [Lachnospiraceae bacterium]|nr:tautomerase family protein [Candidatus Equihabitans merdae]